jgi:hypothetical protein
METHFTFNLFTNARGNPPPPVSRPEDAVRQKETHLKLMEESSDFKPEAGLTLPHTYKLQLSFDTAYKPLLQDWVLTLT